MKLMYGKLTAAAAGALWVMLANMPANAEDIEMFVGNTQGDPDARPNILLILDDSGSMNAEVESQVDYDPDQTYSGNCNPNHVYWTNRGNGDPPEDDECGSTDRYIELDALVCKEALDAFAREDGGSSHKRLVQYDPDDREWDQLRSGQHNWDVECKADEGDHGFDSSSSGVYPQDDENDLWSTEQSDSIWQGSFFGFPLPCDLSRSCPGDDYTLYDGNYVNWYNGSAAGSDRLEIMQEVANNLINGVSGVNIGLMSFNPNVSYDDDGGLVRREIDDVSTSRDSLISAVNSLEHEGNTPLSETLFEAHQYFRGGDVEYGEDGVDEARAPGDSSRYRTPIEYTCQKNHIVLLSDGEPTQDNDADNRIESLVDSEGSTFASLTDNNGCDGRGDGRCLDDLASFMYEGDLSSSLDGQQNVVTHTVGFFADFDLLDQTAERGGGEYYVANDTGSLTSALTSIISEVLETQSTFVAPAVSVNAFNQTRNLNDLYFSVFEPSGTSHWPGNLKRYRLRPSDATILDANDEPAVDQETGFFADDARSIWSAAPDGPSVPQGGAANEIPDPRTVFTDLGSSELTASGNAISTANDAVDNELLGIPESGGPTREQVIAFINGLDPADADNDGVTDEPRRQMGDPLHSRPATVIYGPDNEDGRIYFATNDGYLHSIDTETGVEQWAFVPEEFLRNQAELMVDDETDDKLYGIDGNVAVQTTANRDNVIEDDEDVYIFFGMRRGGESYYGLDVSDPDQPEILWHLDSSNLPGLEQSWSTPVPARIDIDGVDQNDENMVLVIGGGYDPGQDSASLSTDSSGNAVYIVDSESGELLWHASNEDADLNLSEANGSNATMEFSIPGDVKVVDLNSDGFADRLYTADMGGQVWRFDIFNGNEVDDLITGGAFAQLGGGHLDSPSLAETRRFYNAPDTAVVSNDDETFLHIGIGSGYRSHPNSTEHNDRFYALRDYSAFTWRSQSEHDSVDPIVDSDLEDVSNDIDAEIAPGDPGWKFELLNGEKVLAEAVTFDGEVLFSTFRPGSTGTSCAPGLGINRQYQVGLLSGSPVTNLDGEIDEDGDGEPDPLTEEDRYTESDGSILSRTTVIFAEEDGGDGGGDGDGNPSTRVIGCTETDCSDLDFDTSPRRTFWTQDNVE